MFIDENPPTKSQILRLEIMGWLTHNNPHKLRADDLVKAGATLEKFVVGEETHTEDTLKKVRDGIMEVLGDELHTEHIILTLQNAGILFRERT